MIIQLALTTYNIGTKHIQETKLRATKENILSDMTETRLLLRIQLIAVKNLIFFNYPKIFVLYSNVYFI